MPNQFERAHYIAEELTHGDIRGAATNLRNEVNHNPNEALQVIRMANEEAARHGSPNHIEVRGNQVLVEDGYRHTALSAGVLNFNNCYGSSVYDRPCAPQRPYEQPVPPPPVYEGQQPGLSPGAAIGIGVVGGVILDQILHGGRRHEPPRYEPRRW